MIPYSTLRSSAVVDEFKHIVAKEQRGLIHETFLGIEGYVVDVEFEATLSSDEEKFRVYWEARAMTTRERWEQFGFLVQASVANVFWTAFGRTREEIVEAAAVTDPE